MSNDSALKVVRVIQTLTPNQHKVRLAEQAIKANATAKERLDAHLMERLRDIFTIETSTEDPQVTLVDPTNGELLPSPEPA